MAKNMDSDLAGPGDIGRPSTDYELEDWEKIASNLTAAIQWMEQGDPKRPVEEVIRMMRQERDFALSFFPPDRQQQILSGAINAVTQAQGTH